MKISIITSVYNNQSRISNTIESVLSQTYPHIEYIVIDGSSTDNTPELIKSYGNRISKYVSIPGNGVYDALNKGISIATGDIIGILHSDDVFENQSVIGNVVSAFNETQADGVYGDLVYVSKKDKGKIIRSWKSCPFEHSLLKKGWMPPHPALFLRRSIFEKYGNYDTRYLISSDYDFMLRIMSKPELKFAYLPKLLTRMSTGGISNRGLGNILRKSCEDLKILRRNRFGGWMVLMRKNFSKIGQFF